MFCFDFENYFVTFAHYLSLMSFRVDLTHSINDPTGVLWVYRIYVLIWGNWHFYHIIQEYGLGDQWVTLYYLQLKGLCCQFSFGRDFLYHQFIRRTPHLLTVLEEAWTRALSWLRIVIPGILWNNGNDCLHLTVASLERWLILAPLEGF